MGNTTSAILQKIYKKGSEDITPPMENGQDIRAPGFWFTVKDLLPKQKLLNANNRLKNIKAEGPYKNWS